MPLNINSEHNHTSAEYTGSNNQEKFNTSTKLEPVGFIGTGGGGGGGKVVEN